MTSTRPPRPLRLALALLVLAPLLLGCGVGGVVGETLDGSERGVTLARAQVLHNPRGLPDSMFGSAAAIVDWNRDLRPDVVVAFAGKTVGEAADAGAVYIHEQRADGGFECTLELTAAAWPGGAAQAGAHFGAFVTAGDFDGDGRTDLAIGAPGEDVGDLADAGRVYVALASANGDPQFPGPLDDPLGPEEGAGYGGVLAAGDVTGDAVTDLAVAAPGARVLGRAGAGRVMVHVGRVGFVLGSTVEGPIVDPSPEVGAAFGNLTLVKDMNADGVDDLLIAAPGATLPSGPGGKLDVWYRQAGLYLRATTLVDDQVGTAGRLGSSMTAADLDGDGDPDLVVAVPGGTVEGVVAAGYLLIFENVDPASFDLELRARLHDLDPQPSSLFATGVNTGDFDGDGILDIVAGAPGARRGGLPGAGHVTLLFRPAVDVGTQAEAVVVHAGRPADRGAFGSWIEVADLDSDGLDDVAVMAPGPLDGSDPRPGSAHLLFGSR